MCAQNRKIKESIGYYVSGSSNQRLLEARTNSSYVFIIKLLKMFGQWCYETYPSKNLSE
jgi:hypothetical protein